jgi:hypothetical protein
MVIPSRGVRRIRLANHRLRFPEHAIMICAAGHRGDQEIPAR